MAAPENSDRPPPRLLARAVWMVLGGISVALGAIGAFLPVMPTVPFLILAAACFARGSPRMEQWMLNHPRFGAPIRDWRERGAIPLRAKMFGIGGMAAGFAVAMFAVQPGLAVAVPLGAVLALVAAWMLTRPS